MAGDGDRALIVGGGLGGISTALALRRRGFDVALFERGPRFMEVGAGLGIWMNGMRAMQELGLAEALVAAGSPNEFVEIRSHRGPQLLELKVGELARKYSVRPPLMIKRPELMGVLAEALEDGIARFGATCVGYEQDDSGVTARFEDGSEERGAILVAADGLTSGLRATAVPGVEPEYQGYHYLRALVERESPFPKERFVFIWGPGDRFGFSDVGGGSTYWFCVVMAPNENMGVGEDPKQEGLGRYGNFPDYVGELIESTPAEAISRVDIKALKPMESWSDGRVVLIGDAAHATAPTGGRGAGEALEDSVVLADCLGGPEGLADGERVRSAIRRFEERRRPETTKVQKEAQRNSKIGSWSNPVATRMRDQIIKRIIARAMPKEIESDLRDGAGHATAGSPGATG